MARVIIFQPRVTVFSHQVTWPLVYKTVNQIENGARRLVPRGTHRSGSGTRSPGLSLAASIVSRIDSHFDLITGTVGSRKDYAATAHQGSKPHVIRGRGKMLKFEWARGNLLVKAGKRKGGKFSFFMKVRHPGNKRPTRYLTTPLHQFARANGFSTTSAPVTRFRLP